MPAGADRAFKKLGELKANIQWWEAGAQPPQFLVAGDVVMATAYNGRIDAAAREDIAARIESLTRNPEYRTNIITSAATLAALRDANIPVSRIESELDYLRAQVRNAEERNDTVESEKWTRVLDTVARIVAKRGGSVPTPEPLKRVATEPGLTTGTEIAERALRNHRNDLAVMRAAYDQEAARTGKPITQEQQDRISAAEATIRDLTKLARLVKKRGARMPYELAPTAAPKPGDNVVIRLDNGRAVAGVVLKSQAVSKAEVAAPLMPLP